MAIGHRLKEVVCEGCGEKFWVLVERRFCSSKCRGKFLAKNLVKCKREGKCALCGLAFWKSRPGARFCSVDCREIARFRSKRSYYANSVVEDAVREAEDFARWMEERYKEVARVQEDYKDSPNMPEAPEV